MGKKRWKGTLHALGLIILVTLTFGCTLSGGKGIDNPPSGGAVLSIAPTTLKFEIKDPASSSYESSFDVKNIGTGTMYWEVAAPCDFADCDPDSGWIPDDPGNVTVLLKNRQIQSSANGMICINSTGGPCHINVIVDFYVHLAGRVLTREGLSYVAVPDAQVSFGAQYSIITMTDGDGYYDLWAIKEEVMDQNEIITSKVVKDGYQDKPFSGRFFNSGVFYSHDFEINP